MRSDAPTRYVALALLSLAFMAALGVAVHGYLTIPNYTPPPLVVLIVGSGITTAAHVLGAQQGQQITSNAVELGARTSQNGHTAGAAQEQKAA